MNSDVYVSHKGYQLSHCINVAHSCHSAPKQTLPSINRVIEGKEGPTRSRSRPFIDPAIRNRFSFRSMTPDDEGDGHFFSILLVSGRRIRVILRNSPLSLSPLTPPYFFLPSFLLSFSSQDNLLKTIDDVRYTSRSFFKRSTERLGESVKTDEVPWCDPFIPTCTSTSFRTLSSPSFSYSSYIYSRHITCLFLLSTWLSTIAYFLPYLRYVRARIVRANPATILLSDL